MTILASASVRYHVKRWCSCGMDIPKVEHHPVHCGARTAAMPAWMSLLHGSIAADATPLYARLFLVKAVLHVGARHTARMAATAEPAEVRLLHT